MKTSVFLCSLLLCAINNNVYALGLGKMTVTSSLNEPLAATIELTGTIDLDADQILVCLGSDADFKDLGISRESVLLQLKFTPQLKVTPPVIVVSSDKPIREPVLNFVLDAQSPKAQMLKEYTIFLNPGK